jgi:hypothetical protein
LSEKGLFYVDIFATMVSALSLQNGDRVQAKVGPMVYAVKANGEVAKRKSKTWIEGTIIEVVGAQEFKVQFQVSNGGPIVVHRLTSSHVRHINHTAATTRRTLPASTTGVARINNSHSAASALLSVVTASESFPPTLSAIATAQATVATVEVAPGGGLAAIAAQAAPVSTPNGEETVTPNETDDSPLSRETISEVEAIVQSVINQQSEQEGDPPNEEEEDIVEHNDLVDQDGAPIDDEEDEDADLDEHAEKLQRSNDELQALIDDAWTVTAGDIVWKVIEKSVVPPLQEYEKVGLHSFKFDQFAKLDNILKDKAKIWGARQYEKPKADSVELYPYLELFMILWPGNWVTQLQRLYEAIAKDEKKLKRNGRKGKGSKANKPVSQDEWWKFIGIIVAAAVTGYGGQRMWETTKSREAMGKRMISTPPNFGAYMPERRFEDIKRYFHCAFSDHRRSDATSGDYDPWWRIMHLVDGFNANRKSTVSASFKKTLDEIMSGYRPRTSKLGGLPNISFILRKPRPLGTEFKVTCCGTTGIMLDVEIQRGKAGMPKIYPENVSLGATAACTLRQVVACQRAGQPFEGEESLKPNLFYGDSWFASVKTAELVRQRGHEFVGPVKTSSKNFPKGALESKMAGWSGGMSMVMEGVTASGVKLLAIGYKYNLRKVLSFVATRGAGSTTPGNPYRAKFADGWGNVMTRLVPRPDVISQYFQISNAVDTHNQARQSDLALEQHWVTTNCWFRIITTFIGLTVTDAWKAYRHGVRGPNTTERKVTILEFTDRLVWEMLNSNIKRKAEQPLHLSPPKRVRMDDDHPPAEVRRSPRAHHSPVSTLTPASVQHSRVKAPMNYTYVKPRRTRLPCVMCKNHTTIRCLECQVSVCDDAAGKDGNRTCWTKHMCDIRCLSKRMTDK